MMIATTVCSSNENENEVCISVQQEQPPVLVGVLSILNGEDMSSAQMVPMYMPRQRNLLFPSKSSLDLFLFLLI